MYEIIISIVSKYGYIGILLLIAIENIFPPIPSEVILTFSGFLAHDANLNLLLIIIFSTLGSVIGAIILYLLGFILNNKFFQKFIDTKLGKLLHLKHEDIDKSINRFKEEGYTSIFFCRLIPIVRSLISIPAGISKMNFTLFLFLTTIGSLIWNTILILLGNMVGENWYLVSNFFDKYSNLIFIFALLIFLISKYHKRKKKIITIPYSI